MADRLAHYFCLMIQAPCHLSNQKRERYRMFPWTSYKSFAFPNLLLFSIKKMKSPSSRLLATPRWFHSGEVIVQEIAVSWREGCSLAKSPIDRLYLGNRLFLLPAQAYPGNGRESGDQEPRCIFLPSLLGLHLFTHFCSHKAVEFSLECWGIFNFEIQARAWPVWFLNLQPEHWETRLEKEHSRGGCLPCTWSTQVCSPVSQKVSPSLPGVISEHWPMVAPNPKTNKKKINSESIYLNLAYWFNCDSSRFFCYSFSQCKPWVSITPGTLWIDI